MSFGTYQKDEGTIYLDGKEVNFSGPKDALENGIAIDVYKRQLMGSLLQWILQRLRICKIK